MQPSLSQLLTAMRESSGGAQGWQAFTRQKLGREERPESLLKLGFDCEGFWVAVWELVLIENNFSTIFFLSILFPIQTFFFF